MAQPTSETGTPLAEITAPRFDIDFEIAYAGDDNFTGAPVYGRPACYLHHDAAAALLRAIELAGEIG